MPKYLVKASYTQQGTQGLLKEGGISRRETVDKLVTGLGGTLEAFYYAFGEADLYAILDMPDDASMAAIALTVGAAGSVAVSTTVLLDPATIDEAAKKSVSYRPPGQ